MDTSILTKRTLLSPSIRAVALPLSALIILVTLSVVVLNLGMSKILSQRKALRVLLKDENTLKSKESLLKEISPEIISNTSSVLTAVPDKNPTLYAIAQIKLLAIDKGVALMNLKTASPALTDEDLNKVEIAFDIEGNFESVMDFTRSLIGVSPLLTIQRTTISQSAGLARASISARAYWAGLPTELPSLNEPVNPLSPEDQQIFTEILGLKPPVFSEITPLAPGEREDPFN